MSNAISDFVGAMLLHFPPFRWDPEQEKAWASTIATELRGFSPEVLDRAKREMVRTRKPSQPKPPMPSEIINACNDAKRWLSAEKKTGQLMPEVEIVGKSFGEWTGERFKLANELVMSPMGRQAAKEGWIGILHGYARKHSRLPPESEIAGLKAKAKAFDDAYADCVRGGWEQASLLERMGAEMLRRREALADMVLHGVVK